MEIKIVKSVKHNIAIIDADNILIKQTQDALDIMADCNYMEAYSIILSEETLVPEFFDLKTGIAGEILQKFSTYDNRLAIVGDFTKYESKSLNDFMRESNRMGRILFVNSIEEAVRILST